MKGQRYKKFSWNRKFKDAHIVYMDTSYFTGTISLSWRTNIFHTFIDQSYLIQACTLIALSQFSEIWEPSLEKRFRALP